MIPVYQTIDPGTFGATDNGDCLRACLASVLELRPDAVPHFMATAEAARVWPVALTEWLRSRGLEADAIAPAGDLQAVLAHMAKFHPNEHYLLMGQSGADFGHVVIGKGGAIVHDPSPRVPPGAISLQGPLPTSGRYMAMIIRPMGTPALPAPIDFGPLARHERAGLLFSGGKDSIALWHLFRPHLDRLTVYHVDAGDLMPETADIVREYEARTPHFVRINSDARGWIAANGVPSDLLPVHCGPIGRLMHHGTAGKVAVTDKHHCCAANRWLPVQQRLEADGVTLRLQGTRRAEPAYGLAAALAGDRMSPHSFLSLAPTASRPQEIWLPMEDWADEDVFAYLRSVGAPVPRYYERIRKGTECARCPAGWSEGRAAYLKQYHPALAADYTRNLGALRDEILKPLAGLKSELDALAS